MERPEGRGGLCEDREPALQGSGESVLGKCSVLGWE